jgi:hypothetical protein
VKDAAAAFTQGTFPMKRMHQTLFFLALGAGLCATAGAQPRDERYDPRYDARQDHGSYQNDVARVTRVERMASRDDTYLRQECWNERTRRHESDYYRDDSGRLYRGNGSDATARTLIGAVIGGALGNQIGSGDGRKAATVAGAVVGGAIGNRSADDKRYDGYDRYRDTSGGEVRCRTVEEFADRGGRGEVFRVTYVYGGKSYQAMTRRQPGRTLRVTVDVRPRDDLYVGQR